jgi:hypothetical protein
VDGLEPSQLAGKGGRRDIHTRPAMFLRTSPI